MKIALISHEYPPFFFGGVGSHCKNLAEELSKKGFDVTVFAGRSTEVRIEHLNPLLKVVRLPYLDFPPRPTWFQFQNFRFFQTMLNAFDIVHVVDVHSGLVPIYVARRFKKPVITSIHSVPPIYYLKLTAQTSMKDISGGDLGLALFEYPNRTLDVKYCLKNSTKIVSCGFYALDKMRKYLMIDLDKVSVIYNGINLKEFNSGSTSKPTSQIPRIVFIGRFFYFKGISYLINAVSLLKKSLKDFSVELFGDGPLRNRIEQQISQLGLHNEVHLHGFVRDRRKLLSEIRAATVIAIPSLLEVGPSIAHLEAMACKKVIVAFDMPFTREFITDMKTGILAKPCDSADLAQKLKLVLMNEQLCTRIGQNAYEYVRDNHDWSKIVEKYIDLYNMVSK